MAAADSPAIPMRWLAERRSNLREEEEERRSRGSPGRLTMGWLIVVSSPDARLLIGSIGSPIPSPCPHAACVRSVIRAKEDRSRFWVPRPEREGRRDMQQAAQGRARLLEVNP